MGELEEVECVTGMMVTSLTTAQEVLLGTGCW